MVDEGRDSLDVWVLPSGPSDGGDRGGVPDASSEPVPFGALLRNARQAAGLSQRQLAARLGRGQQWVWQMESGIGGMRLRLEGALKVVRALGLDDHDPAALALLEAAGRLPPRNGEVGDLVAAFHSDESFRRSVRTLLAARAAKGDTA